MSEHGYDAIELVNFPDNYELFTSVRHGPGPKFEAIGGVDRYLYGHPNGRFRSPKEFYPHLLSVMNGDIDICTCGRCKVKGEGS